MRKRILLHEPGNTTINNSQQFLISMKNDKTPFLLAMQQITVSIHTGCLAAPILD